MYRLRFALAWAFHRVAEYFARLGNAVLFGPRARFPSRERIEEPR